MKIEKGLQPNCSELIIRLKDEKDAKTIKDKLEAIGIKEYLIKDLYNFKPKPKKEWDEDANSDIILFKSLSKKVQKLWEKAHDINGEKEYKELVKLGYNPDISSIVLLDSTEELKMPNGTITIYNKFDGDGPAIVGHQHCNDDMFPLLDKISRHFYQEVEAYDGGSTTEFEEWLDNQEGDE